jgi:hypothetical protein
VVVTQFACHIRLLICGGDIYYTLINMIYNQLELEQRDL